MWGGGGGEKEIGKILNCYSTAQSQLDHLVVIHL